MDLYLFTDDPLLAAHLDGYVDGFVIDWEVAGKSRRQLGWDTQISSHSREALRSVRDAVTGPIIVRVNNIPGQLEIDLRTAVHTGADEVLIPMVEDPQEIHEVTRLWGAHVGIGTMLETRRALEAAAEISAMDLTRAFIGLNDLAIERRDAELFAPFVDGTVEHVRDEYDGQLGFGGMTDPDRGTPIPARTLLAAMVHLHCDFTFLRRSFHRDVIGQDPRALLSRMRAAIAAAEESASRIADGAIGNLAQYVGTVTHD